MAQMVFEGQGNTTKEQLAEHIQIWPSPKWVRVYFGGKYIADSKKTFLVREKGHILTYYFPRQDVRMDLLEKSGLQHELPGLGQATYYTVTAGREAGQQCRLERGKDRSAGRRDRGLCSL